MHCALNVEKESSEKLLQKPSVRNKDDVVPMTYYELIGAICTAFYCLSLYFVFLLFVECSSPFGSQNTEWNDFLDVYKLVERLRKKQQSKFDLVIFVLHLPCMYWFFSCGVLYIVLHSALKLVHIIFLTNNFDMPLCYW